MRTIIKKLKQSVVGIKNEDGIGSGFFIKSGIVVTNHHVAGEYNNRVKIKDINNNIHDAIVVFADKNLDVAFLEVHLPKNYSLPQVKTSENIEDTEATTVYAIGHPSGLSFTVTKGIVSSIRNINNATYIQTDASINPGNSGGPLFFENGDVIGMNSFILTNKYGIGFALSMRNIQYFLKNPEKSFCNKNTEIICSVCHQKTSINGIYCEVCGVKIIH